MLTVDGISCSYGPIQAVRDVSLDVPDASLVCILGANGAGKSTTLKAVAGLVTPKRGRILLGEKDITRAGAASRVGYGIALSPEGRQIFTEFTVRENLLVGGHRIPRREIDQRLGRAMDLFPILRERMHQPAASLSGGEQQMLAIARALMTEPTLLLLDEPSLGLAPLITQQVFQIIQDIRAQGTTVILVEQNARMALKIADYAYVLANGRVDMQGPAQEIMAAGEIERSYLGG